MKPNLDPSKTVHALCERLIEGTLTPEESTQLEQLILTNKEARRAYIEHAHLHASLHWLVGAQGDLSLEILEGAETESTHQPSATDLHSIAFTPTNHLSSTDNSLSTNSSNDANGSPNQEAARRRFWTAPLALVASMALGAIVTWLIVRPSGGETGAQQPFAPQAFATLVEAKNAKWGASRLPTESGTRLAPGHVRLIQGLARIQFDNNVTLTLEAPADLELVSPLHCILHHGVLVARVSPEATGFLVETATARLIDHGTEFGVATSATGETQVQVMEGIVDVEQRTSGGIERLFAGQNSQVTATEFAINATVGFEAQRQYVPDKSIDPASEGITLTTASRRGKDAYVQTDPVDNHGSDVLLLVKNAQSHGFRRKAYLGFDLEGIPVDRIREARLVLAMAPTGYGYASFIGTSTFSVYGLTDHALNNWNENTIHWDNAPANRIGGGDIDPNITAKLGTFEVGEGVTSGEFSLSGPDLTDFLRQATDDMVTFIIVRDTPELRSGSLVHGFVSKRHPIGPPPMLRILLDEPR